MLFNHTGSTCRLLGWGAPLSMYIVVTGHKSQRGQCLRAAEHPQAPEPNWTLHQVPRGGGPLWGHGVYLKSSTYRDWVQKSIRSCRYHNFNLRSGAFLPAHSDMGEGPCVSQQPESRVVGDSGGECPEHSVSQIGRCRKLGVSSATSDAGCRGEYTGCLLERAGMLGEYMLVVCGC